MTTRDRHRLAVVVLINAACGDSSPTTPGSSIDLPMGNPNGVLLDGAGDAPASDAVDRLPPTPVDAADIDGGLLLTRLTAWLERDAKVAEVNAALTAHGATIITMWPRLPAMTLRVPRFSSADAGRKLSDALQETDAFRRVDLAWEIAFDEPLPPPRRELPPSGPTESYLDVHGFPAAWNAAGAARETITVLVPDGYAFTAPAPEISAQTMTDGAPTPGKNHGYGVCGILAANFDATHVTGTSPAPTELIDLRSVPLGGLASIVDVHAHTWTQRPTSGKFIINTSIGDGPRPAGREGQPYWADELRNLVDNVISWRILMSDDYDRWLHVVAAGNDRDVDIGTAADARYSSGYAASRYWDVPYALLPPDSVSAAELSSYELDWQLWLSEHPSIAKAAPNVVVVGSADLGGNESTFSNAGADVHAVGEDLLNTCVVTGPDCDGWKLYTGSSFASPIVSGLAAYLWSIRPDMSVSDLRTTLLSAYETSTVPGLIDAYAAVLSLDAALDVVNAPVRLALVDVTGPSLGSAPNGIFDEHDIEQFLTFFESYRIDRKETGVAPDHSRYDLNGNEYTGDDDTDTAFDPFGRIDLDLTGGWSLATLSIEGQSASFNESQVTDLDMLCYLAYSPLYAGNTTRRRDLLAAACGAESFTAAIVPTGQLLVGASVPAKVWVWRQPAHAPEADADIVIDASGASFAPASGTTGDDGFIETVVTVASYPVEGTMSVTPSDGEAFEAEFRWDQPDGFVSANVTATASAVFETVEDEFCVGRVEDECNPHVITLSVVGSDEDSSVCRWTDDEKTLNHIVDGDASAVVTHELITSTDGIGFAVSFDLEGSLVHQVQRRPEAEDRDCNRKLNRGSGGGVRADGVVTSPTAGTCFVDVSFAVSGSALDDRGPGFGCDPCYRGLTRVTGGTSEGGEFETLEPGIVSFPVVANERVWFHLSASAGVSSLASVLPISRFDGRAMATGTISIVVVPD